MDRDWITWKRRPETVGHKLRLARRKAGLTQREMANRCSICLRTYRAYETDNHLIDEEMVEVIEQAFGLN